MDGEKLFKFALPDDHCIAELKKRAKKYEIPIIYINDNFGKWQDDFRKSFNYCSRKGVRGNEIVKLLKSESGDYFVLKPKHSAFYSTSLDVLLEGLKTETLIINGFSTDIFAFCLRQTMPTCVIFGFSCREIFSLNSNLTILINDYSCLFFANHLLLGIAIISSLFVVACSAQSIVSFSQLSPDSQSEILRASLLKQQESPILSNDYKIAKQALEKAIHERDEATIRFGLKTNSVMLKQDNQQKTVSKKIRFSICYIFEMIL